NVLRGALRRLTAWDQVVPFSIKLRGDFFDSCDCRCRCSLRYSLRCKGRMPASGSFERFHWCPRLHNALDLTPVAWRNGLRLLTGEYRSALYVTTLQTLQRVVLETGDRHGVVLLYLRHIHLCRAH